MPKPFEPVPDDLLRQRAGAAAWSRGVAYHAERRVDLLAVDGARTLALVRGTQVYRVELLSQGARQTGSRPPVSTWPPWTRTPWWSGCCARRSATRTCWKRSNWTPPT